MNRFVTGYKRMIKSKGVKIFCASLLCFCAGAAGTGFFVLSMNKAEKPNGIGGLETNAVPEFTDEFAELAADDLYSAESLLDNLDSEASDSSIAAEDSVNTELKPAPLTYLTYRVKKGDMIGFIADDFNVTQDTIISINNIKQSRLIQPGQYLKIPSMPGILYTVKANGETPQTIAKKYDIDAQKCALVNSIEEDTILKAGMSLFVPDAELDWMTRQEINGDLFKKPLHSRYYLSSSYGWRDSPFSSGKRSFHSGIDMAAISGTSIYPAMDGTVITAGYNSVYGNYVIIQHHSGYKTLYGHMSRITCKKGNFVYTNTKIGEVGSTGLSTGPHLHFTVYKNGKTVNPLGLIN